MLAEVALCRSDLKRFDVPTRIVHGDEDRVVPIAISGKKSHELIAGSRYEVDRDPYIQVPRRPPFLAVVGGFCG